VTFGIAQGLGVLVWSGLCAADQRAVASRQIHQPLVAAVVTGLILGSPEKALPVGLWLQLVWPTPMPVGGALLPDTGSAAVVATLIALSIPGGGGFAIALVIGLLAAWFTIPWERRLRHENGIREERALASGGRGLTRAISFGVAGAFSRGVFFALMGIVLASLLAKWPGPLAPDRSFDLLTASLIGAAGTLGLAGLLARVQRETGRTWASWVLAGLLIGAAGRFLIEGSR
jgi:mannose/fructose/N-acetylgalactosamine-specific phosphotransferase system component IIC